MNILGFIIVLLAFLLVMYAISFRTKACFVDILPVTTGSLILLLYFLAFFRAMEVIVIIAASCIVFTEVSLVLKRGFRKYHLKGFREFYLKPQPLVIMAFLILIAVLTKDKVTVWWDDINFWATDAKGMYFLNGFPGKYGNVAPEFGDYPPATGIFKWCFLKLSSTYREGLAFSGYYVMFFIFLLPVLRKFKDKNIVWQLISVPVLYLMPGVVNVIWALGSSSDVIMGAVFGAFLMAALDYDRYKNLFYYVRLAVYLSVLVLCKSSGFQWAIYGVIFLLILYIFVRKERGKENCPIKGKQLIFSVGCAVLVQASWWIFCLIERRVAKLTGYGVSIVKSGNYTPPDNAADKWKLFLEGFFKYPMHTDPCLINISSFAMILIFAVVIIALIISKKIRKNEGTALLVYTLLVAVVVYLVIFIGHVTLFAGETQYDTANVMTISISRYASPFTLGIMMLLLHIILSKTDSKMVLIGCALFILVSTEYASYYDILWGYRMTLSKDTESRDSVIDSEGSIFRDKVSGVDELAGHRVLYLRDASVPHTVTDTYVNFAVAPVPVVYESIDVETMNEEQIKQIILNSHASYLYVENQSGDPGTLFGTLTDEKSFEYATIYEISNNGVISLRRMGE